MNLEIKRWVGRGCWCGIAVFFGWVAVCITAAFETMLIPGLPSSGGWMLLGGSVATPLYGLLNWGVPGAAFAAGTLAILARQRIVSIERVVVAGCAVIAITTVVVILGGSFCREVLGTASLADGVWWMLRV